MRRGPGEDGTQETGGAAGSDAVGGMGGSAGASTTGGTTGQNPNRECFPTRPRCGDGQVTYIFSTACTPKNTYTCALGCRAGEPSQNSPDDYPYYCEETAVRYEGFPCRADVDCAAPEGTEAFFTDAGTSANGTLHCDTEKQRCVVGSAAEAPVGAECAGLPSVRGLASVSLDTGCESGACLTLPDALVGQCSRTCTGDSDCPSGWSCAGAVDQRYIRWERDVYFADVLWLPQLRTCAPR